MLPWRQTTTISENRASQQIDQGVMYSSSPDDKLSENIWFVWSKTSYDGYKWRCYHGDDERRTISENRASQQIYQGLLTFAISLSKVRAELSNEVDNVHWTYPSHV